MTAKKPRVGHSIESWCTKCKMDREHTIETLKVDGNVNKVRCCTCDGSHLYRRPKGEAGAAAAKGTKTSAKSSSKKSTTKRRKKSDSAFSEAELAKAKPYDKQGEFASGDVLQHPKFGPGRVVGFKPVGKMEVAFENETKVLLCAETSKAFGRRGGRAAPKPEPEEEPAKAAEEEE